MAYVQARSGLVRSNAFHCGWTPPLVKVYIAGVDQSANVLVRDWTVTQRADGAASFNFYTDVGFDPTLGNDVRVTYAGPDDYIFGGTLLQRSIGPNPIETTKIVWSCVASDYRWLINRYDRVVAQYASVGVGTMVADILYRFADGFRVGYIPSSLGNLTMDFTWETVWGALTRIAAACSATVRITADRVVDMFDTYPEAAIATVTNVQIQVATFALREDLSQVRNIVYMEGQGSQTTVSVGAPTASTIPLTDVGMFSGVGSSAVCGRNIINYTGRSADAGSGSLTGVTGMVFDLAQADEVHLLGFGADSSSIIDIEGRLGGGLSGQITHYLQDRRLSLNEADNRAGEDVLVFGFPLREIDFAFVTARRHVRAGRRLVLTLTVPISLTTGSFTVQSVTWDAYGKMGTTNFKVFQRVSLAPFTRTLTDLLD